MCSTRSAAVVWIIGSVCFFLYKMWRTMGIKPVLTFSFSPLFYIILILLFLEVFSNVVYRIKDLISLKIPCPRFFLPTLEKPLSASVAPFQKWMIATCVPKLNISWFKITHGYLTSWTRMIFMSRVWWRVKAFLKKIWRCVFSQTLYIFLESIGQRSECSNSFNLHQSTLKQKQNTHFSAQRQRKLSTASFTHSGKSSDLVGGSGWEVRGED